MADIYRGSFPTLKANHTLYVFAIIIYFFWSLSLMAVQYRIFFDLFSCSTCVHPSWSMSSVFSFFLFLYIYILLSPGWIAVFNCFFFPLLSRYKITYPSSWPCGGATDNLSKDLTCYNNQCVYLRSLPMADLSMNIIFLIMSLAYGGQNVISGPIIVCNLCKIRINNLNIINYI